MSGKSQNAGIFDSADKAIASFFGLHDWQLLKRKTFSRNLAGPAPEDHGDFSTLLSQMYAGIESDRADRAPSQENWRCRMVTTLSDHNKSPEVLLERAVAMMSEAKMMPGWFNQVPVASGLVDDRSDKRAALDLVVQGNGSARLVEIKWKSDTPAYAAFEILRYGLAYLFCRVNAEKFGYSNLPLMQVGRVNLQVVAPRAFYTKTDLAWLQEGFNQAIGAFASQKTLGELTMGFEFLAFPPDFDEPPFLDGAEVKAACKATSCGVAAVRVRDAFSNLTRVWPS